MARSQDNLCTEYPAHMAFRLNSSTSRAEESGARGRVRCPDTAGHRAGRPEGAGGHGLPQPLGLGLSDPPGWEEYA